MAKATTTTKMWHVFKTALFWDEGSRHPTKVQFTKASAHPSNEASTGTQEAFLGNFACKGNPLAKLKKMGTPGLPSRRGLFSPCAWIFMASAIGSSKRKWPRRTKGASIAINVDRIISSARNNSFNPFHEDGTNSVKSESLNYLWQRHITPATRSRHQTERLLAR